VIDKLVDAGYVTAVTTAGEKVQEKTLEVTLSYVDGAHSIRGVKRISKPGRRLYTKVTDIHPVKFGQGAHYPFYSSPESSPARKHEQRSWW